MSAIRPFLLKAHRSACLQHNEFGQATIINLLLRSYLNDNLYDQAAKLVAKVTFPEAVSANQYVLCPAADRTLHHQPVRHSTSAATRSTSLLAFPSALCVCLLLLLLLLLLFGCPSARRYRPSCQYRC